MKDLKNLMGYKDALLDAKKEMDNLIKRYGSVNPRDSYGETFQKARLMGYRDAIYRINVLIGKYESEKQEYPILDELNEVADAYAGHPYELDENLITTTRRDSFKDGAKWQMEKDFNFFTGKTGTYNPNIEISDEDKLAALKYAYDMDAYVEGEGPCISDVINGYYGGLLAQRKKEKDDSMKDDSMKDSTNEYVSIGIKRRLISIIDSIKCFKFGEKIKTIILNTDEDK